MNASKYCITNSISANLPDGSTNRHCLILLLHPPLVRDISKLMSLVLNFVNTVVSLFLISLGLFPEKIISNRLLARISFFCSITSSSLLVK